MRVARGSAETWSSHYSAPGPLKACREAVEQPGFGLNGDLDAEAGMNRNRGWFRLSPISSHHSNAAASELSSEYYRSVIPIRLPTALCVLQICRGWIDALTKNKMIQGMRAETLAFIYGISRYWSNVRATVTYNSPPGIRISNLYFSELMPGCRSRPPLRHSPQWAGGPGNPRVPLLMVSEVTSRRLPG
jgi:hypothetical protein